MNGHAARARNSDPISSHAAARKASFFADSHKGRIMAALQEGPRSSHGLAAMAGLTLVQTDRRLPELQSAGMADVLKDDLGNDVIVGGYRVWVAK